MAHLHDLHIGRTRYYSMNETLSFPLFIQPSDKLLISICHFSWHSNTLLSDVSLTCQDRAKKPAALVLTMSVKEGSYDLLKDGGQ